MCSDDDLIYPNRLFTSSSSTKQDSSVDWISVEPGHDQRPTTLPKFDEKVGPTFPVGICPSPAIFYEQMIPDFLFDYIVMCTNTRARLYFDNISSSSGNQQSWKPVRLSSRF